MERSTAKGKTRRARNKWCKGYAGGCYAMAYDWCTDYRGTCKKAGYTRVIRCPAKGKHGHGYTGAYEDLEAEYTDVVERPVFAEEALEEATREVP